MNPNETRQQQEDFARSVSRRARAGDPVTLAEEEAALAFYFREDPRDVAIARSLLSCLLRQTKPVPDAVAEAAFASVLDADRADFDAIDGLVRMLQGAGATVPWSSIRAATERWARAPGAFEIVVGDYVSLLWSHGRPLDHAIADPAGPRPSTGEASLSPTLSERARAEGLHAPFPLPSPDPSLLEDAARELLGASLGARLAPAIVHHAPVLATIAARSIASDLSVDREPMQASLQALLERWTSLNVGAALGHLSALDVIPGDPYLAQRSPEDLLRFMVDATRRVRQAGERGLGPMPLIALPKTGSAFLAALLCRVTDVPACSISFQHRLRVAPWVRFAARHPVVLHDHFLPLQENVQAARDAGVSRLVLHVRDPRSLVVSLAHHAVAHPDVANPALRKALEHGLTGALDAAITRFPPLMANWVRKWVEAAEEAGMELRITRFEDMARDPVDFAAGLFEFWNAPPSAFDGLRASFERMKAGHDGGIPNLRSGRTNEWTEVLTAAQVHRIAENVRGPLAQLYDL